MRTARRDTVGLLVVGVGEAGGVWITDVGVDMNELGVGVGTAVGRGGDVTASSGAGGVGTGDGRPAGRDCPVGCRF